MGLTGDEIRNIAQTLRYADLFAIEDADSLTEERVLFRQIELVVLFRQIAAGEGSSMPIHGDDGSAFREFVRDANIYTQFCRTHQDVLKYHPIIGATSYWETLTERVQLLLINRHLVERVDERLKAGLGRTKMMGMLYEDLKIHFLEICPDAAFLEGEEIEAFEFVFNQFYQHAEKHLRKVLFAFEEYRHHYLLFINNWLQKCETVLSFEMRLKEVRAPHVQYGHFLRSASDEILRRLGDVNDYLNQDVKSIEAINARMNCVVSTNPILILIDEFKQRFGISAEGAELNPERSQQMDVEP